MPVFGRELLIGALLGLAAAWAYHRFAVPRGAPVFPVIIGYDKIGQAIDRMGVPFSSYGINPSR
jgi:hypothetical protein